MDQTTDLLIARPTN